MKTANTLENWVDKYATMLYRIAFARVLNEADAEDVLQEVYLKYLRYRPDFNDDEHAKAWFIRVTCQQSRELGRQRWRKDMPLDDAVAAGERTDRADTEREELRLDMEDALRRLSEDDREILHLSYYEGLDSKEIARLTDRTPGAVRMQLTRARRKLQDIWEA